MKKNDEKNRPNDDTLDQIDEGSKSWWIRVKEEWQHAFSMKVDEDQFNDEDIQIIDEVAKDIVNRRLASPAVLFLVSVQPLTFLMAQGMQMVKPFMPSTETATTGRDFAEKFALKTLITRPGAYSRLALLLETQEGVDRLVEAIEKHEDNRLAQERAK